VARRRSHSDRARPVGVLRSALLGALLAVLLSGLLNVVVGPLAQRGTPEGTVPAHLGERLYYAWATLSVALARLTTALLGRLGYAVPIALVGAAIGALAYALPDQFARRRRSRRHSSHKSHIRRRRAE